MKERTSLVHYSKTKVRKNRGPITNLQRLWTLWLTKPGWFRPYLLDEHSLKTGQSPFPVKLGSICSSVQREYNNAVDVVKAGGGVKKIFFKLISI